MVRPSHCKETLVSLQWDGRFIIMRRSLSLILISLSKSFRYRIVHTLAHIGTKIFPTLYNSIPVGFCQFCQIVPANPVFQQAEYHSSVEINRAEEIVLYEMIYS